jgi:hypothetical protein
MIDARREAARDLLDLMAKAGAAKMDAISNNNHSAFIEVAGFFDYVGTLVRFDIIDKDLVYSRFYRKCFAFWQAGREIVDSRRSAHGNESRPIWNDFEELAESMRDMHFETLKKVAKHRVCKSELKDGNDWLKTLKHEASI